MYIVVLNPLQNRVLHIIGLYQHTALSIHTPGTAAHLLHKLEGALVHPEVRIAKQAVGAEHTNQAYRCKV